MASFASEVSVTQSDSFFSRFGRFGGDMKLLKQLLSDDDRMRAWVESLLVTAPVEHLTAFVSYQLPPYRELDGNVFDYCSELLSKCEWQEHESIRGKVDRTPGDKNFLVKHFNKKMAIDQVIEWAEANGYRAATYEEAVDFAKAHPDLQRQFWIVALGSFVMWDHRGRTFAELNGDETRRRLTDFMCYGSLPASCSFLLIRK